MDWNEYVKREVKAATAKAGMDYGQLVDKLAEMGIKESSKGIRSKISRGAFSATFFLQVMVATGNASILLPTCDTGNGVSQTRDQN